MQELYNNFINFLIKNWYSKKTVENYWRGVSLFINFLLENWLNFNCGLMHIEQWKNSLTTSNRTINLYLHWVRKLFFYLNYIWISKLNPKNILLLREHKKECPYITKSEVNDIFYDIDNMNCSDIIKLRSKIIIKMLWDTWLRVSELISIKWGSFNRYHNDVYVKVIWKGEKERVIFIPQDLLELLLDYRIECLNEWVESDFIFCSFSGNSKGNKLSRNSIEKLIQELNKTNKHITPHSFRHWMATYALQNWCNIVDLQKLLGHSNISTTSTYLHSNIDRIKNCQSKCR